MARIGTENGSTPCYSLFSAVLPAQTWGLLSRGSQVRILPGAPIFLKNSPIVPSAWAPGAKVQAKKVTGHLPRLAD